MTNIHDHKDQSGWNGRHDHPAEGWHEHDLDESEEIEAYRRQTEQRIGRPFSTEQAREHHEAKKRSGKRIEDLLERRA